MKKAYTYNEIKAMHIVGASRVSPTISGVVRSRSIIINPSDVSSGIKPYRSREIGTVKD